MPFTAIKMVKLTSTCTVSRKLSIFVPRNFLQAQMKLKSRLLVSQGKLSWSSKAISICGARLSCNNSSGDIRTRPNSDLYPFRDLLPHFSIMARNVSSETGAEVNANSRESPLLSRYFRGVHRPAIRETRNFRDENFRYRFLKWTALFVSTLFVIGGGIGVGGTLWALSKTNYSYLTSSSTSAGVYMLMISVFLLLLTGVVGFVGVLRHNKPVMGSFIVLLFVSLVFLLVGGIWTYVTTTQTDQMSLERVANIVQFDYGRDSSKTALLDIVQQSFRCCGSSSFSSWMTSSYSLNQTETIPHDNSGTRLSFTVPKSCCIEPASQNCQDHRLMASNTTTNQYIYTKGCVQKLQASNTPYGTYALCVSLAIAVLQIIGLAVSFLLFRTFHYLDTLS